MSQQPAPTPSPAANSASFQEQVIFDGSPSWVGRIQAFMVTIFLGVALVAIPVVLRYWNVPIPWWTLPLAVALAFVMISLQVAILHSLRFRITNYRVDYERGVLTRKIDSLELWHVEDVNFRQNLLQRLMGVGTIELLAHDHSTPRLVMQAIPNARMIFEQIKTCILAAKKQRGLLEVDQ